MMTIKKLFDVWKSGTRKMKVQALDRKRKLEIDIKQQTHTVLSLDAEEMYPSIKFKLVEKAVTWLSQLLSAADQVMGHSCLEFIKFGMGHTLLMFGGVYYECDGDHVIEEKGLKIGGYELVWLVDLVTANLLKNVADARFEDTT